MQASERRISNRKEYQLLLRFRVMEEGNADGAEKSVAQSSTPSDKTARLVGIVEGQSINLSERGICFTSQTKLSVGEPIEMYFTLPRELTGRGPEDVRCVARVVHVEPHGGQHAAARIGAAIERFEPWHVSRRWAN